jgi:hypothetical protein
MKLLFLIYLFCLFVIFTPGIFMTFSNKNGLKGVILHGIFFALVVFLSMKLFKNKLVEGAEGQTPPVTDETVNMSDTDKIMTSINDLRKEMTQQNESIISRNDTNLSEYEKLQNGSDFDSNKFHFKCIHNLKNGNFDKPVLENNTQTVVSGTDVIPNWRVDNVYHINNSETWGFKTPYPMGNQAIAIQNIGNISTDLMLPPGKYKVEILANGRTNSDQSIIANPLTFVLNDTPFDTIQPEISIWKKYVTKIFTIKNEGTYKLTIRGDTSGNVNNQSNKTTAIKNINISRQ